jgi:hypothetical protein
MHALTALATPPTDALSPGTESAAAVVAVRRAIVGVAVIGIAILGIVIIRPSAGGVLG